jgi:hypothetical protein
MLESVWPCSAKNPEMTAIAYAREDSPNGGVDWKHSMQVLVWGILSRGIESASVFQLIWNISQLLPIRTKE